MKGFLHSKYLWKAAFMAGHYMMFLNQLISVKEISLEAL